jgi:formylglycine-generating enzyme required for sulfatase activity
MSVKIRLYAVAAIAILVILVGIAIGLSEYTKNKNLERQHFKQQETKFVVSSTLNISAALFRSGSNLSDCKKILDLKDHELWLPPGNYFLDVKLAEGKSYFFPVPVSGYQSGPDEGAFAITIRDKTETAPKLLNDIPEYAYVPAGHFLFGDRINPQEPHYVWLTSYYIGRFEVSNLEFQQFIQDPSGYDDLKNWNTAGTQWKQNNQNRSSALLKPTDADYSRFGQPDQPVTNVSWYEASAYCKWLTRKIGGTKWLFSLPSEAEWEKAARGPDGFDYGLGMKLSDDEVALYNWKKNPTAEVTVVGNSESGKKFRPNRYGLYHASGNVVEWTTSVFLPFNRSKPYDEYQRNRDDLNGQRVARGGSWYSASIALLYLAYRDAFQPDIRNHDLGFRIVAKQLP